jgi:hypothetical protein
VVRSRSRGAQRTLELMLSAGDTDAKGHRPSRSRTFSKSFSKTHFRPDAAPTKLLGLLPRALCLKANGDAHARRV